MKCLLLVCLFLILAEFSALACHCPHCPSGYACVGFSRDPLKSCVCVTEERVRNVIGGKKHGNKKGMKFRTKHMKAPLRFRKKTKHVKLHRKKAGKKI